MTMPILRDERVRAYVERLEREAHAHPRRHAVRLALLLLFGYAYPLLMVLLAGAAIGVMPLLLCAFTEDGGVDGFIAWVVFLAGALWFAWWVVRAFATELPEPEGRKLQPGEARALQALVEEVRAALHAPPVEAIYLNADFNAGVHQRFRWWIAGPMRHDLVLGLPLLAVYTPEELRAVLAHEFGHISGNHGRLGLWLYRLFLTWEGLSRTTEQVDKRTWLLGFLARYARYLSHATLAIRRRHEYAADRVAAVLVGVPLMARALTRLDLYHYRASQEFWPALRRLTAREPLPPADIVTRMAAAITAPLAPEVLHAWWRQGSLRRTGIADDHPCLCDRLAGIGYADLQSCPEGMAVGVTSPEDSALSLLGDGAARHLALANATWKAMIVEQWRAEHALAKELLAAGNAESDDAETAWKAVQAQVDYAAEAEGDTLIRRFLARVPDYPAARYHLGCRLLARGDDAGIAHLDAAIAASTDYAGPGLTRLLEYFREHGRDREADAVQERLHAFAQTVERAKKERTTVSTRDTLLPHELPAGEVERVRRVLRRYVRVTAAYLARKAVKHLVDKPGYVLAVVCARPADYDAQVNARLAAGLAADIHLVVAVTVLDWSSAALRKRIAALPGALIYGAEGIGGR